MADDELQARADQLQAEIDRLTQQLEAANAAAAEAGTARHIGNVGIKIGPFWKRDPALWFDQLEAQFALARITVDDTKYFHVVSKIDAEILECCADIIRSPPEEAKYQSIKDRIIGEYAASTASRMQALLHGTELGDRKPSQLLREMKTLAVGIVSDDDLIKQLWLQRLPEMTQAVLNVVDKKTSLKDLAMQADKLAEVTRSQTPAVMSIHSTTSELHEIKQQIQTLTLEIDAFRRSSNAAGRQEPAQRKPDRGSEEWCWYHRRFGQAARRCQPPCKFPKN